MLSDTATHIKKVCWCISQPLSYRSNHLSRKHIFSRSKCLGLRSNERDDICPPTGRSMSWVPLPPSISDAGYRFLSVTCRSRPPFTLLSKLSLRNDFELSSWLIPLDRWIPDNVSVSLVSVPPVGQSQVRLWATNLLQFILCPLITQAATALSNSTAIQEVFNRTTETVSSNLILYCQ
jgi:hypothetical protein